MYFINKLRNYFLQYKDFEKAQKDVTHINLG